MTIGDSMKTFMCGRRNWQIHNTRIATAIEHISSGRRINRAADGVAEMAISERMRAQLTSLSRNQAIMADYISAAEIADGKFETMQDITLRLTDLAAQSANGTMSDLDRSLLDKEYQALIEELSSIGSQGMPDMPQLLSAQGGQGEEGFKLEGGNLGAFVQGLNSFLDEVANAAAANDTVKLNLLLGENTKGLSDKERLQNATIEFTRQHGQSLLDASGDTKLGGIISFEGGRLSVFSANGGKNVYGLKGTNIKTASSALEAMQAVKNAAKSIGAQRAEAGALYNMYERTQERLLNMEENLTASLSRITDADIAKEMMAYAKEQVLSQASMFVMAQGRHQAEDVLALLKI